MSEIDTQRIAVPAIAGAPEAESPRPELSAAKQALREARLRGLHRAAPMAPAAAPAERPGPQPLSFAQERLWFLEALQPGTAAYVVSCALRVSGPLDAAALERALGEMVRRHEGLRTTFRADDGAPVAIAAPFAGFRLAAEDLSALPPAAREEAVDRWRTEDAARPFDLVAGPIFRAVLLRLGAEDHVLLLAMHHVVCDGWSLMVLFRELWAVYDAFRDGRPSPLPPLAARYADYAAWQREQLRGAGLERLLAYWKDRLAGAPELLELPTDHPRPPVPTFRGAAVPVGVPAPVLQRLRALERAEGASLFMVVLAAFQLLLSRYAGADDVVVGTPTAGRTRREVEGIVGLFVNTLVLRGDLSGDPTFRELVRRVRERTLADYAHQELPFERLVAEVQPERSLSHAPLFQVWYQLDADGAAFSAPRETRVRMLEPVRDHARFDLSLVLDAGPGGLEGVLEYALDLFHPATARRMGDHLARLLEQAALDPDRRISALELLDDVERARVVTEWNRTDAPYPADACIHPLIQAQAARMPDAVALVSGDEEVTYAELDARANQLARRLVRLGAGPDVPVGICLERSAGMVAAMLAVLKAGAAYLPLDPAYPVDRLAYMREDSGASILVTQSSLRGLLPSEGVQLVLVDEDADSIAAESAAPVQSAVRPANAAYVIYTSGSTGRPKGVIVTHGNAVSFFTGMDERVGGSRPLFPIPYSLFPAVQPGTWLALTRIGFDIHVLELLWTLARGFRVVVHPDVVQAGGEGALAREIARHGVTHLQCTPSLASVLVAESGADALAGVERVLLGGEPLPPALAARITEVLPGGLLNMYGPTETTVWSTTHAVLPGEATIPIGRPIANTRAYVLDAALRPQPAGVPGELYLGGPGVTRGYHGRPGLTAERYLPDPFSATPGARLYRTGDRARWTEVRSGEVRECESAKVREWERGDPAGDASTFALSHSRTFALECLGRVDAQVKIRGFRIEPGEVEAALRRHPSVRECAVVARDDAGGRRLAAYVVADAEGTADALRAHLRGVLPEYMVPASFTRLDRLPRLPNGKLDRRALPAPAHDAAGSEGGAPRNQVEARLIGIWQELLGRTGIGPVQSFFDLGGDSFRALHLFARVNRAFGCVLPVATLFAGATVRDMADAILEQRRAAPAAPAALVPLQTGGPLPPLFLVHAADRDVLGYVNLLRRLGPEQPAFGIRDVGELSRPVPQIAAEHLAEVRAVQPRGPYALAGWSFGGMVALEMAVQLRRAGEAVAFVGMLDTIAPDVVEELRMDDDELLVGLAAETAEEWGWAFRLPPETLRGLPMEEKARRIGIALRAQGPVPEDFRAEGLADAVQGVRDRHQSGRGYRPEPFHGTVTLYRATVSSGYRDALFAHRTAEESRTLGWGRHVRGTVDVQHVPGSHVTLAAEPHVQVLAERMRRALAEGFARAAAAGR